MEVSGNFLWISGLDIDFLASLYHNRVNSDSFEPLVQHPRPNMAIAVQRIAS